MLNVCFAIRILLLRRNLVDEVERKQEAEERRRWTIWSIWGESTFNYFCGGQFWFVSLPPFLCDVAESFIWVWIRLRIRIREESSGQRLRGREAPTSSVWLRIPVWIKVWVRLGSVSSEGPTGSQERKTWAKTSCTETQTCTCKTSTVIILWQWQVRLLFAFFSCIPRCCSCVNTIVH